jgi:hypothetical protein
MMLMFSIAVLAAATSTTRAQTDGPLGCFLERPSSSTVKNMCERAFYDYPAGVNDAAACAAKCVADEKCVMFAWSDGQAIKCRLSATCKQPTNALPGYDGYFRNSTVGDCSPQPGPTDAVWTRVFLDDAKAKGAVCIDGSPGAFYIRTTNANGTGAPTTNSTHHHRHHHYHRSHHLNFHF